mmetsp:Transcript_33793/g.100655  ORF Transcript_33793/g.100655 Transcript_33793/m.100655 type:complete len:232 (-) Transcript_33793:103-798(-)
MPPHLLDHRHDAVHEAGEPHDRGLQTVVGDVGRHDLGQELLGVPLRALLLPVEEVTADGRPQLRVLTGGVDDLGEGLARSLDSVGICHANADELQENDHRTFRASKKALPLRSIHIRPGLKRARPDDEGSSMPQNDDPLVQHIAVVHEVADDMNHGVNESWHVANGSPVALPKGHATQAAQGVHGRAGRAEGAAAQRRDERCSPVEPLDGPQRPVRYTLVGVVPAEGALQD